jgi:hypothetical protein
MYWKFRDFYEGGVSTPESTPAPNPKPTEPSVDLPIAETPTVEVEESEAVKNFRAKYGTPSNPKAE